jgi:hypothetical protein
MFGCCAIQNMLRVIQEDLIVVHLSVVNGDPTPSKAEHQKRRAGSSGVGDAGYEWRSSVAWQGVKAPEVQQQCVPRCGRHLIWRCCCGAVACRPVLADGCSLLNPDLSSMPATADA